MGLNIKLKILSGRCDAISESKHRKVGQIKQFRWRAGFRYVCLWQVLRSNTPVVGSLVSDTLRVRENGGVKTGVIVEKADARFYLKEE